MFTNPLDNIGVASPCPADWNEMLGDERKRFCSECKLNVYNLSGMTRQEAENLLINSEGRLCVRFFRRADGTVLTKDCPVGWARMKRDVSRMATAAASVVFGFVGGLIGARATEGLVSLLSAQAVPEQGVTIFESKEVVPQVGEIKYQYQGEVFTPVLGALPTPRNIFHGLRRDSQRQLRPSRPKSHR